MFNLLLIFASIFFALIGCSSNGSDSFGVKTPTSSTTTPSTSYSCGANSMASLGSVATSAGAVTGQSVFVSGNYAYMGLSGTPTGLQIVDISNPSSPSNVSFLTTQTGAGQVDATSNDIMDLVLDGSILYGSTFNGALLVISVSNPASPSVIGTLDFAAETWGIAKSGNYVYVGSTTAGLYVIDVSTPASPSLVTTIASMPLKHMQVVGTKIYGSTIDRIQVVDIATPSAPVLLGETVVANHSAYETYYKSNYVYALDKANYVIKTYDVSDPANITLVNTTAAHGTYDFRSIDGYDSKLYISTGAGASGEILVFDISTATTPTYETSSALTNRGYEMMFKDGIVYSSNLDGKLQATRVCTN